MTQGSVPLELTIDKLTEILQENDEQKRRINNLEKELAKKEEKLAGKEIELEDESKYR